MQFEDEQLGEAFARLDVIRVAAALGEKLKPGLQKSPFREDKRGQSFSVFLKNGRYTGFKDHSTDEGGGVWQVVALCRPEWSKKKIRDWLVEESGQNPKSLTRGQVKREVAAKRQDLYEEQRRKMADIPRLEGREPGPMSVKIRGRWNAGFDALMEVAESLAASRGWDMAVMRKLVGLNKISSPLLPWSDKERGWAWMVEKPVPRKGSAGRAVNLIPVGYHERYRRTERDGSKSKGWTYVPSVPSDKKADGSPKFLNDFQRHLRTMGDRCPAYPFVLGDLVIPRLVVILEGQFDAVSFAAAFRWLDCGFPTGVSVFGLRGVQSQKAFLAGYGFWLHKSQPFVWIVGDNDAAGRKIDQHDAGNTIVKEPSFVDRIRAQGCEVHAELIQHPGCKDFNDVYKLSRPSLRTMLDWAALRGINFDLKTRIEN